MILHINNFKALTLNYLQKRPGKTISPQMLFEDLQKLSIIKTQICESIRNEIFCESIDLVVERHLNQIQQECIELIDMVDQMTVGDDVMDELGAALVEGLEEVLNLIEIRYVRFFNLGALAPIRQFKVQKEKLLIQVNKLKLELKKREIAPDLRQVVIGCYVDFLETESASYAKITYLSKLQDNIIRFLEDQDGVDIDYIFSCFLIHNRFNYEPFIDCFKHMLAAKLEVIYDSREKMAQLAQYEKDVIAQGEQFEKGYSPRLNSAKALILDYLKAEIRYINRQSKHQVVSTKTLSDQHGSAERVRINLSVDAMIYLVRLFVEANIIIAQPRSKLIALIAKHIETPGTRLKPIAIYSATKKYEQVVQTTAILVRSVLKRMLKLLESQFNFRD